MADVNIIPQEGFQQKALSCEADILICGASAGCGKTWLLLVEPLRFVNEKRFNATIFRRTYPQINGAGGMWDKSMDLYGSIPGAKPVKSAMEWRFPNSTFYFNHYQNEDDWINFQGTEMCYIGFDELTQFSRNQFFKTFAWNRPPTGVRVKPYIRATCLHGDSVIITKNNELKKIKDCSLNDEIATVNLHDGQIFYESPSRIITKQIESGLRIKTSGKEIKCSPDHKFFRWSQDGIEEVEAGRLKVGDHLASMRELPHGELDISSFLAYLIGYTVGDGGITGRSHIPRLMWTESDAKHASFIKKIARTELQTNIGIHKRKNVNAYSIYTTSCPESVANFIDEFKEILISQSKRSIPVKYTALNDSGIKYLLMGLFDAEGHVNVKENRIEIGLTSYELISQVSIFLKRFGIFSTYTTYQPKGNRSRVYKLSISGTHAEKFAKRIGFKVEYKRVSSLNIKAGAKGSDTDTIPIERSRIQSLKRFFGKSWWNKNKTISRSTSDRICAESNELGINDDLFDLWGKYAWDKINSIDAIDEFKAYDLTMPTTNIFLTGQTVSHNCNPDPDSFVADMIAWYIGEDGFPIPERDGVVRYFVTIDDEEVWGNTRQEVYEKAKSRLDSMGSKDPQNELIKSFSFIKGSVYDNKALLGTDPNYLANLMAMSEEEQLRFLHGNWKIKLDKNIIFNYAAFRDIFTNDFVKGHKRYITADIATTGRDCMVIAYWEGKQWVDIEMLGSNDGREAIKAIEKMKHKYGVLNSNILFDADGVGGGLTGWIANCVEFHANKKAVGGKNVNYKNLKSQLFFEVAACVNQDEPKTKDDMYYVSKKVADTKFPFKSPSRYRDSTIGDILLDQMKAIREDKPELSGDRKKAIIKKDEQKTYLHGVSPDFIEQFMFREYFEKNQSGSNRIINIY